MEGVDDAEEFGTTIDAMRNVGMSNPQIQAVLSLLAAILHLGNVEFRSVEVQGTEGSEISSVDKPLAQFCELLKLHPDNVQQAMLMRELQTMAPGGRVDTYMVPQNPVQAAARRDAIAKALFERLFDLMVDRINVALDPEKQSATAKDMLSIGCWTFMALRFVYVCFILSYLIITITIL